MRTSAKASRAAFFALSLLGLGNLFGCAEEPAAEKPEIGYLVGPQQGRWVESRTHRFDPDLTDEQRDEIAKLESLGYVEGIHAPVAVVPEGLPAVATVAPGTLGR